MRSTRPGGLILLTLDEFVARARERGAELSIWSDPFGLTDGARFYPLPAVALRRGLSTKLVGSLCRHFGLSEMDFALDAPAED